MQSGTSLFALRTSKATTFAASIGVCNTRGRAYQQALLKLLSRERPALVLVKSVEQVHNPQVALPHAVKQDEYRLFAVHHRGQVYLHHVCL